MIPNIVATRGEQPRLSEPSLEFHQFITSLQIHTITPQAPHRESMAGRQRELDLDGIAPHLLKLI